ncbi:MAG: M15 family metallopeptidase [Treponema sp.]|jgi:hypothetical protein|nr:M15 family metallopeptidase [Treponema sp.]
MSKTPKAAPGIKSGRLPALCCLLLAAALSGAGAQSQASRGELVVRALAAAYPDRIGAPEVRDGDWAVPLYGIHRGGKPEWYFYAEGRLLPESLRARWSEYGMQSFYRYPKSLPPWKPYSRAESADIAKREKERRGTPARRSHHFYDALFRASSKTEAEERVKQICFLGITTNVHYSILEELSLVEEKILALKKTNKAVRDWVESLKSADAWNWRSVAETESRSFHSYGTAIDLLPQNLKGLQTYWLWASRTNPEWWNIPYTKRFHPPKEVIEAFEEQGFIWGGKWFLFDTMHFEYRPEIPIYSRLAESNEKK